MIPEVSERLDEILGKQFLARQHKPTFFFGFMWTTENFMWGFERGLYLSGWRINIGWLSIGWWMLR
jgi:hypothetical protein